ncbi:MAG: minor capsid protein [Actinomycetia bacterium]|nr:minor capsid protein [Actinomycetes bacterium]
MTNWLEDLQNYLIAQGVGSADEIFRDLMPDDPTVCMSLHGDAGELPEQTLDGKWIMHPGLQVMVRDTDSDHARAWVERARQILVGINGLTIGAVKYLEVKALQEAMPLGTDEAGAFVLTQNFIVTLSFDSLSTLAKGTKLIWNGAEVAEVLNLGDLELDVAVKDTSWGQQKARTFKPGMLQFTELEVVGTLIKEGDSISFYQDATGRVIRSCELKLPAGFGLTFRFEAFVNHLNVSFATMLRFTALLKITGGVELAVQE